MLFSKKWLRNHKKFLLHFLMYIDVLMLCTKFELIPTNNFPFMTIINFKNPWTMMVFPITITPLPTNAWIISCLAVAIMKSSVTLSVIAEGQKLTEPAIGLQKTH